MCTIKSGKVWVEKLRGNMYMNGEYITYSFNWMSFIAEMVVVLMTLNPVRRWQTSQIQSLLLSDILHTFSKLPRNLNFVEHTSRLGWKEGQRAKPLIVDPGLYMSKKSDVFWVGPRRELPTAFKLFTGSAWMALSREFVEFCVWGWDNLPRTLLMYYTNFVSSPEGYFQTVICNAPEFASTVANHDLHYIAWDVPPKQHPHTLGLPDLPRMLASNAPFARKFNRTDPVLDRIDAEILRRSPRGFVPGGWCSGTPSCSDVGDPDRLRPSPGAQRVAKLMGRIVRSKLFSQNQCK